MSYLEQETIRRVQNLLKTVQDTPRASRDDGSRDTGPTPRCSCLGLSDREVREYSILRGLSDRCLDPLPRENRSGRSLEFECDDELEKRFGPKSRESSIRIPADILYRSMDTQPGSKGGYAVGTSNGSFIDTLRNLSFLSRLGIQHLSDQFGNLTFPRRTTGSALTWLTPGGSASDASPLFKQSSSTPKTCLIISEMSEQLMRNMNPAAEQFFMSTLARDVAAGVDQVGLAGTGGVQPLGILNTPGVDTSVSGSNLVYQGLIDVQGVVAELNAVQNPASLGYVTTPSVAKLLKARQRFTGTDSPLWQGGLVNGSVEGARAVSTKAMSAGKLIFGDFSSAMLVDWGVLELSLDRSGTRFNQGQIGIRALWMVDLLVLYPESFAVINSIT